MIGHVFASSGAVCLAVAPSSEHVGDYVVLARVENGYAIADVDLRRMPLPDSWMSGSYFTHRGGDAADLAEAVAMFAQITGIENTAVVRRQAAAAEVFFADTIRSAHAALAAQDRGV